MKSGIYSIYCRDTERYYVGQSVDIERRLKEHINSLVEGVHPNKEMQRDYDIYGGASFEIKVEKYIEEELLNVLEGYYIELYKAKDRGYNKQNMLKKVRYKEERGSDYLKEKVEKLESIEVRGNKLGLLIIVLELWLEGLKERSMERDIDMGDCYVYVLKDIQRIKSSLKEEEERLKGELLESIESELGIKLGVKSIEIKGVDEILKVYEKGLQDIKVDKVEVKEVEEMFINLLKGEIKVNLIYGVREEDKYLEKEIMVKIKE